MIEQIKVKNFMERKRIISMIGSNDNITKQDFAYQSINQARMILSKCIKKQDMMSQLLECIKDKSITGFQLKDIINEFSKFEDIKAALQEKVDLSLNKIRESRLVIDDEKYKVEEEETDEQKKVRMGYPAKDIEELLKDCGLSDSIAKLKENKVDTEVFWEMEEDKFESVLDVKIYGLKQTLALKRKQFLKEHKKAFDKAEEAKKEVNKESLLEMLNFTV